jgi:MFS transporter, PAT family, beta-lactamase induction signal transducer AmpG
MATQDIAVDAYTTEQLNDRSRNAGAVAVGIGDSVGYVVGISAPLILYAQYGWAAMIFTCAAVTLVLSLPALIRREIPVGDIAAPPPMLANLTSALVAKSTPVILLLMLIAGVAGRFMWSIYGPLLSERGLSLTEVGTTLGLASAIATILGSAFCYYLMHRKAVGIANICALFASIGYAAFLMPASNDLIFIGAIVFVTELLLLPINNLLFASRMSWCRPGSAGTDFTIQSSVFNLGRSLATIIAAPTAALLGWPLFFAVNAGVLMLFVLSYLRLDPVITRRIGALK